jgi:hypothetical protein
LLLRRLLRIKVLRRVLPRRVATVNEVRLSRLAPTRIHLTLLELSPEVLSWFRLRNAVLLTLGTVDQVHQRNVRSYVPERTQSLRLCLTLLRAFKYALKDVFKWFFDRGLSSFCSSFDKPRRNFAKVIRTTTGFFITSGTSDSRYSGFRLLNRRGDAAQHLRAEIGFHTSIEALL